MNDAKSPRYISNAAVLVLEPDLDTWHKLEPTLRLSFGFVKHTRTVEQAKVSFQRFHFDLMIIDSTLLDGFWISLAGTKQQSTEPRICTTHMQAELWFPLSFMVMSRSNDTELLLKIMRMGACDFLAKPLNKFAVDKAMIQWQSRMPHSIAPTTNNDTNKKHSLFIGESRAIQNLRKNLYEASLSNHSLLIQGEVGAGKKLAVKQLQLFSSPQSQIINIDCRDASQIDWDKTANICTKSKQPSLLVIAHIDLLSISKQYELLQLLHSPAFQDNSLVRLISLSELSLLNLVKKKTFLNELYYHIAVMSLTLPPLSQHPEDIVILVKYFANQLLLKTNELRDNIISRFQTWQTADFLSLTEYFWQGNIQQLKHTTEQCLLLNITPKNYIDNIQRKEFEFKNNDHYFPVKWTLKQTEKAHILRVMDIYQGNRILAAEHLGVARKTIDRKIKEWGQD